MPPSVIPQVRVSPIKNIFIAIGDFIFPEASALAMVDDQPEGENNPGTAGSTGSVDLKSEIETNKEKYSNFKTESEKDANLIDMTKIRSGLDFKKKSDFGTCDFNFKADFYATLQEKGTIDLMMAILAYDFVTTGDSENDYWTINKSVPGSSLNGRLKKVGQSNIAIRKDLHSQLAKIDVELTCMCLDAKTYGAITDAKKKKFFEESCPQYAKYIDPKTPPEQLKPDASGIKAKELLVEFSEKMLALHENLTVVMADTSEDLKEVQDWVKSEAKWNDVTQRNYNLFKFNIKNPSTSVAGLGAIVGALLAAGVIAILGGFATSSLLSSWAAAGIISASAVTGASGLWMMASLKGAWISKRPAITDSDVTPRTYSCGKKETCKEYTRTLLQPYNDICKVHASANACLKNFIIVNDKDKDNKEIDVPRYVIDPWVPVGVARYDIYKGQPLYTEKIELGFQAAKAAMTNKNPGADGGGGKKGGGEYVSEAYLSEIFIDADVVGKYLPLGTNAESIYSFGQDRIKIIKEAAKKFAISEGLLEKEDTANLDAFANYAYDYHFVWPKKSRPGEISYPTVGLSTYLDFMVTAVAGTSATTFKDETDSWRKIATRYTEDLKKTYLDLKDTPINQTGGLTQDDLSKKLDKINQNLLNFRSEE
ncbi:MAG: hypothetical protein K2Q18_18370, partial [Bdellovibrionales bacterium]|nr:hypothetical protein [Bdellovibrionales bacterium]